MVLGVLSLFCWLRIYWPVPGPVLFISLSLDHCSVPWTEIKLSFWQDRALPVMSKWKWRPLYHAVPALSLLHVCER